jgi:hypothetical protein
MSAGRGVGRVGSTFGGSSCTSVIVVTRFAIGASLERIRKHVSHNQLWMDILEAQTH